MIVGGGLLVATGVLEITGLWNTAVQLSKPCYPAARSSRWRGRGRGRSKPHERIDEIMGSMTSMPLLPEWLRFGWAVALVAVIVTHVWHGYCTPGQHRWWHAGHVLTAAGMVVMYLPGSMAQPDLSLGGMGLFGGVAAITAGATAVLRHREGVLNPLWVVSAVDMLIMAYMWLPPATRPSVLDYALAGYLGCQLLAWSLGLWERVPVVARSTSPASAVPTMARAGKAGQAPHAATPPAPSAAIGLIVHHAPVVQASLAVMAASMSYMLIVS